MIMPKYEKTQGLQGIYLWFELFAPYNDSVFKRKNIKPLSGRMNC